MGPPQAERKAAKRRRKSTRSVPSRQGHRRKAKKAFLASFLCLTKRMEKFRRGFYWFVRSSGCGVLIRGLQNLESFLKKVLIVAVRSCHCGGLNRGLQNLGASCEGERVVTFCIVQKVTKKHAGLRPATSIQIAGRYVIFSETTGVHQVTGNAENRNFPGIAGNDLNRCEVQALQHKIRANSKRTAVFFANSRLRVVGMEGGGWERVALDGKKERFVRINGFLYVKKAVFEDSS